MDVTTTKAFQEVDMPGGDNPTLLEGSCFCAKVRIRAKTNMPYPFMVCHCISCRKTGGAYCVKLAADKESLKVEGREHVKSYRGSTEIATERFFCGTCGSMLWGEDNRYPQRIYPAASCLDTDIPRAPEEHHVMAKYKQSYLRLPTDYKGIDVEVYPENGAKTRETWHTDNSLFGKAGDDMEKIALFSS
ncbi:g10748 [Coccomyxa viridis]|uniref:G10748 protein n=1 Tax=Coccomyxa viridis TaxID=1274662 RepID=A0ABP1GAP1_9CHLO